MLVKLTPGVVGAFEKVKISQLQNKSQKWCFLENIKSNTISEIKYNHISVINDKERKRQKL